MKSRAHKKNQLTTNYFYIILLIVIMFSFYVISALIYLTKPARLEPRVLYYYSVLDSETNLPTEAKFMPEIRNVKAPPFLRLIQTSRQDIELDEFFNELFLGSQNVYAVNFASEYLSFEYSAFDPETGNLYVNTKLKDNVKFPDTPETILAIEKWLEYNIKIDKSGILKNVVLVYK